MADYTRKNISLYEFHEQWIEEQREERDDFNFSEWVREKIEEEANDAPAFMEIDDD